MTLSVVIPFYDETIFIRQTVASCLALDDALHEIIIVNDGPLDVSAEWFAGMLGCEKVRVIKNLHNLGHPGSRNVGMREAKGQFAMWLDADDLLVRNTMLEALKFAEDTHADITHLPTLCYRPRYGAWERFERDRDLLATGKSGLTVDNTPELRYSVATWSWLFRTSYLQQSGVELDEEQLRYVDHLHAVDVLQPAKRISTFARYPHIWRRRGASMSTNPENEEQFQLLIDSIGKTCDLLLEHYSADSVPFQRDLAFFLMRLLGQWQFLRVCIPHHGSSRSKASLLKKLASELRRYPFDPAIISDEILRKIARGGIGHGDHSFLGLDQLPRLHSLILNENWDELGESIGIANANESTAAPWTKRAAEFEELSPSQALWRLYSESVREPGSMDQRLFSEFLLDEIDALCRTGLATLSGKTDGATDNWSTTMHTDLSRVASRFGASALFPPHCGWTACRALRDKAAELTDTFVMGSEAGADGREGPRRNEVLDAWRAWESAMLGSTLDEIFAKVLILGQHASYGDANWQAKRTFKSRIRAKVIEPLTGA